MKGLPPHLEEQHTRVSINPSYPTHTQTLEYHSVYASLGIDNSFNLENFKNEFKINVISMNDEQIVFDMIGIDAAIANTIRRILIAEVPTLAISSVYVNNNTSIIQDEVLAHRLGLVPIKVDPNAFDYRQEGEYTDKDSLVFEIDITCTSKPDSKESDPEHLKYNNSRVYSGNLVWKEQGSQLERLGGEENKPRPVDDNILLAKLRPGQVINCTCFVEKGIGKDHAKWSPVATATYRLLPEIKFTQDIVGDDALELVKKCPMNVFDIEDMGGIPKAYVKNPRNCSVCRECIREPNWSERVKIFRVKNHFIFSVESTGIIPAKDIFLQGLQVFNDKLKQLKKDITSTL